jgi:hypothetical protein
MKFLDVLPKHRLKELLTPKGAGYLAASRQEHAHSGPDNARARSPKEVARMISNKIPTTEMIPSHLGMPVYGRAFGIAAGMADVCVQTTAVVLGATAGRTKGDFPGTSAWRPPSR